MSQKISIGVGPHNIEIHISMFWLYDLMIKYPFIRHLMQLGYNIFTRCRYSYTPAA